MKKDIIGIFGGTFNPPHLTHTALAKEFVKQIKPKKLLIFPCFMPPHKAMANGSATPEDRLEMARLAFGGIGEAEVSDFELKREESSYTYLTVEHLKTLYKDEELCLLMGYDNLFIFEKWRRFEYLLQNCRLVVADRGEGDDSKLNAQVERLEKLYSAKITVLKTEKNAVSSSKIREALENGNEKDIPIDRKVLEYIKNRGLYGTGKEYDLEAVSAALSHQSPKRRTHTEGTKEASLAIAENHFPHLSKTRVATAALLHDLTKELSFEEQLDLCSHYGIPLDDLEKRTGKLLHAKTGAYRARELFDVDDGIFNAIMYHTTGKADMSPLEKILFLADFIEPNRKDELCVSIRNAYQDFLAENKDTALDRTLLLATEKSVNALTEESKEVHPHTIEARNFYLRSNADEGISCGSRREETC